MFTFNPQQAGKKEEVFRKFAEVSKAEKEIFTKKNPSTIIRKFYDEHVKHLDDYKDITAENATILFIKEKHLERIKTIYNGAISFLSSIGSHAGQKLKFFVTQADKLKNYDTYVAEYVSKVIEPELVISVDPDEEDETSSSEKIVRSIYQKQSFFNIIKDLGVPENLSGSMEDIYTNGPSSAKFVSLFFSGYHFISSFLFTQENKQAIEATLKKAEQMAENFHEHELDEIEDTD